MGPGRKARDRKRNQRLWINRGIKGRTDKRMEYLLIHGGGKVNRKIEKERKG